MSTPTKINGSPVGAREGQRVILREITASLHNSPPSLAISNKNVNDAVSKVPLEHEVKVKFAREFGDVANYPPPPSIVVDSISSASSFQSLTSSLSTKSSSGICVDSPARLSDESYTNFEVSGLDDLISACAAIHLGDATITGEQSFADATFASATDELNQTRDSPRSRSVSPNFCLNGNQTINTSFNVTRDIDERDSPNLNLTQDINSPNIDNNCNQDSYVKAEQISPDYATASETFLQHCSTFDNINIDKQELNSTFAVPLPPEAFVRPIEPLPAAEVVDLQTEESTENVPDISSNLQSSTLPTLEKILGRTESALRTTFSTDNGNFHPESSPTPLKTLQIDPLECSLSVDVLQSIPDISTNYLTLIKAPTFIESQNLLDITKSLSTEPTAQSVIVELESSKKDCENSIEQLKQENNELPIEAALKDPISENINNQLYPSDAVGVDPNPLAPVLIVVTETEEEEVSSDNFENCGNLDTTINIDDITTNFFEETETEQREEFPPEQQDTNIETIPPAQAEYNYFLPQRQSTSLDDFLPQPDSNPEVSPVKTTGTAEPEFSDAQNVSINEDQIDFEKLQSAGNNIVNDINSTSVDLVDNNDPFASASTDLWRDPTNFDFLLSKKANSATTDRLRAESLYVKFDPLVSDTSMLPQGNGATASPNEERNGEKEASVPNIGTPKRNPAIAAIDRLLFYSPMTPGNQKSEEPKKIEPTEKTAPEPTPIVDTVMAKELELVRATVLQLEEQLEKQKLEQQQQEKEHKVDREAFQEAITQLQKQLNQEVKSKNQINVVVDEYEKSISRLVAERERDRNNLDVEKASLLEELQEVKNHLAASEAAFNDVHAKYERLKVVVTASKNNEAALKASIAENVEVIKTLEDRYDQIKTHAAVRLEKANLELEGIRKQHESETLKLRAMLRKEELKSSSLAEMIEQKTKENKELTKILDEVIARVDPSADQ